MKKFLLSIILLFCAGIVAFFIKDLIDRNNPDHAVPQINVMADTNVVTTITSGYVWTFAFGEQKSKDSIGVVDLSIVPTELIGGELLDISFSRTPISYTVSRSGSYNYQFEVVKAPFVVTYEKGGYIYKVDAEFEQGTVEYYFYLLVT